MKRLRYISSFTSPMTEQEIAELVAQAQAHNEKAGITGTLVATGQLFYQLIEGPDAAVDALFARIVVDERHKQVMLLSSEQGDLERLCPDWAMRRVELDPEAAARATPAKTLLRIAYKQRQLANEAVAALETYTWKGLLEAEMEFLSQPEP